MFYCIFKKEFLEIWALCCSMGQIFFRKSVKTRYIFGFFLQKSMFYASKWSQKGKILAKCFVLYVKNRFCVVGTPLRGRSPPNTSDIQNLVFRNFFFTFFLKLRVGTIFAKGITFYGKFKNSKFLTIKKITFCLQLRNQKYFRRVSSFDPQMPFN